MSLNAVSGVPRGALSAVLLAAVIGFSTVQHASATTASAASAVQTIATAQVNNFTSPDWNKGTWRKSAGFSIPATTANKAAFQKEAQVKLANGQIRTVKVIYFSGAHMSVMLSGTTLDAVATGYPHTVAVLGSATVSSTPPATSTPTPTPSTTTAHSSAINNYTNSDWLNGVWRKSAGFSIPLTTTNRSVFKPGASVKLANSQTRSITAVYISGRNMSVMLSGSVLSGALGYPNKLFAATTSTAPSTPTAPTAPSAPVADAPSTSTPATSAPLVTALNSFNGTDFVNGVYRSTGISVKASAANKTAYHKGAKVRFANGQVLTVKVVYHSGDNMTVMLDGGTIDGMLVGYPRTVSVSSTDFTQPSTGTSTAPATGTDAAPANPIHLVGVNLAGAEFGEYAGLPGQHQIHYIYPSEANFKRYADLNLKLIRLPFRWERIQPKLNGELNAAELGRLLTTLNHAQKYNMQVILDMHNYYRYYGKLIASTDVPISAFADGWRRIVQKVANHPAVYGYGLMNEPHSTNGKWPAAALAAARAIRGIDQNRWIYVSGDRWSSAFHWPSYNTQLAIDPWMRDPKNNLVYEAHLYLDKDYSGTYANRSAIYDPMTGVNRAKPFVEWLRKNRLRGFIGEHGAPDFSPSAIVATDNLLKYLNQNCIPSTYWAAGPWWGEYALSLDVKSGSPRPQLPILQKHAANKSCGTIGPLL